ncbi:MAG: hypothetical protein Q8L52_01115 [bacterium]|nr:hypothetical protein [bacterium]
MKKIETIWHHLLWLSLEKREFKHTQKKIAEYFGYSLSTVNLAVKQLALVGAIDIRGKFFIINDAKKILLYWATHRNIQKSIIYETYVDQSVQEIEGLISFDAIIGGYSAVKYILKELPSDYSKVYFYIDEEKIEEVKKRFPKSANTSNLIVLKAYSKQDVYGKSTSLPQTFVDIWNMNDWYAKDFLQELERKIDGLLS